MKRKKTTNYLALIALTLFIGALFYAIYQLILWKTDSSNIDKQTELIESMAGYREESSDSSAGHNPPTDSNDPYWSYIKIPFIQVNISELKKINPDTKGWIKVENTNINYPFVQNNDNDYYLTHAYNKRRNQAGWIFADYRNNFENLGDNTILYGHGRVGGKMFGTLKNVLSPSWYTSTGNHVVRMATESSSSLWQVFSIYRINETNDYLQTFIPSASEHQLFLSTIKDRSIKDFDVALTTEDKVLTLSSCLNEKERIVLHAKLIKIFEN